MSTAISYILLGRDPTFPIITNRILGLYSLSFSQHFAPALHPLRPLCSSRGISGLSMGSTQGQQLIPSINNGAVTDWISRCGLKDIKNDKSTQKSSHHVYTHRHNHKSKFERSPKNKERHRGRGNLMKLLYVAATRVAPLQTIRSAYNWHH